MLLFSLMPFWRLSLQHEKLLDVARFVSKGRERDREPHSCVASTSTPNIGALIN